MEKQVDDEETFSQVTGIQKSISLLLPTER